MGLVLLLISYLYTRLYHLTILPIFFDEANFIFWAKTIAATNQHWFISLSGGKNILLPWLMVPFLKIAPSADFLLAGRLTSVATGAFTLVGIYFLARELFSEKKVALITCGLYILLPFTLLYDRMALYDSLLTATTLWATYYAVKTARTQQVSVALKWGGCLGLAVLSKATALVFVGLTPVIFLVLTKKAAISRSLKLGTLALVVSQLVANVIIFSSGYRDYLTKSLDYTPGAAGLAIQPLVLLLKNLPLSFSWLTSYFTWPLFLACVLGLVILLFSQPRIFLVLSIIILVPIFSFSFVGRIYFPRYLLFLSPYFLLGGSIFLRSLWLKTKKALAIFIYFLVLTPALFFSYQLLTNPTVAPLPQLDAWQYVTGSPSGYGLQPLFDYLDQKSKNEKITLFVQGSYSHYPNAFHLQFWDNKNIRILERWPLVGVDQEMIDAAKTTRVYYVLHDDAVGYGKEALTIFPSKVIIKNYKPGGADPVYLTEL